MQYTGNMTMAAAKMQVYAAGDEAESVVRGSAAQYQTGDLEVGEYSDIKVDTSAGTGLNQAVPVIAYWNKTSKSLEIARTSKTFPTNTDWTYIENVRPGTSEFGRYVSLELDDKGGIHITAQDSDNNTLWYGYAPKSATEAKDFTWYKVDATGFVGHWTDLKLGDYTKTGFDAKPVISYINIGYSSSPKAVKIAYYEDVTRGFECITDPALYDGFDKKTSIVVNPSESDKNDGKDTALYGVGFNSTSLCVDFLRGE